MSSILGISESLLIILALAIMGVAGYLTLNRYMLPKDNDLSLHPRTVHNITVVGGKGWVVHPEHKVEGDN